VKVYDGVVEIASTTADATGAWSATATNLGDGAHNFTTTVTDVDGNTSAPSAVRAVRVDSVAPVASPVAAVARDGGAAVGSVTNAKTVTLSGTAEAGAVVKVLDGTREVGTATADASGAWSVAANNLSEGAHNFTTTVTDEAGNASGPSAVRTVTVDTVAPSTPIVAKYTPDTGPVGDGVTSAKAVTLSGTAEAGATVKVLDGTKEVGTATADASGAWSVTTGVLAEGDHAFTTKATDAAGDTGGASAPLSVRIDSRPVITSNGGIKVFEGFKPVTTIKATDSQAGALSYSIAGGADASKFVIDPVTGALAFTAIPDYENPVDAGRNNVYDVTVKVTDADGNSVTQDIAVTVADMRPDPVFGDDAANLFIGRPFAEAIVGYAGVDTVSYELAGAGVTANLATPFSNRGEAAGDLYKSIENLTGSAFNDKLVGDGAANVLDGGAGGDRLEGGGGSDTASYARAASGVTADLTKSANNSGEAAGDTYSSIENLTGSQFADRLVGNSSANVLTGRDGADTLIANAGNDKLIGGLGPDTLNAGAGRDLYAYSAPSEGGDLIQGFVVRDDQIQISASGFKGGLVAGQKLVAGETLYFQHRSGRVHGQGNVPLRYRRPGPVLRCRRVRRGSVGQDRAFR
jgi:Ca2+-binding RTX toxin-like protein